MLAEFVLLASLTLDEGERKVLREEVNEWVKNFLPKLERESSREEKCRLIASIERHDFEKWEVAGDWRFIKFNGKKGILLNEDKG